MSHHSQGIRFGDESWQQEESGWFGELQKSIPIAHMRQQHSVFRDGEAWIRIQRFEFDFEKQIGMLALAKVPHEVSAEGVGKGFDLEPYQYDVVIHADAFDFVYDPTINKWHQHARYAYLSPPTPPLPMAIRFQDHPRIQAEKAYYELVRVAARNSQDSRSETLVLEKLATLAQPPSSYVSKAIQIELSDGDIMDFFGDPSGDEFHFEIAENALVTRLERVSPSGIILERIDNDFETPVTLPILSDEDIGDLFPFHHVTPEGARELVHMDAMGIRFSRRSGAWTLTAIWKDSPAEQAGLQQGDVMIAINGYDLADIGVEDFPSVFKTDSGFMLDLLRDGKMMKETVPTKHYKVMLIPGEPRPIY